MNVDIKKILRDGESNPGLPRDRRGYSPLYYRGADHFLNACYIKRILQPELNKNAPIDVKMVNCDLPYLAFLKSP